MNATSTTRPAFPVFETEYRSGYWCVCHRPEAFAHRNGRVNSFFVYTATDPTQPPTQADLIAHLGEHRYLSLVRYSADLALVYAPDKRCAQRAYASRQVQAA